jgi:hypothetical protein
MGRPWPAAPPGRPVVWGWQRLPRVPMVPGRRRRRRELPSKQRWRAHRSRATPSARTPGDAVPRGRVSGSARSCRVASRTGVWPSDFADAYVKRSPDFPLLSCAGVPGAIVKGCVVKGAGRKGRPPHMGRPPHRQAPAIWHSGQGRPLPAAAVRRGPRLDHPALPAAGLLAEGPGHLFNAHAAHEGLWAPLCVPDRAVTRMNSGYSQTSHAARWPMLGALSTTVPVRASRWLRVPGAVPLEAARGEPHDVGVDRDLDGGVAGAVVWPARGDGEHVGQGLVPGAGGELA